MSTFFPIWSNLFLNITFNKGDVGFFMKMFCLHIKFIWSPLPSSNNFSSSLYSPTLNFPLDISNISTSLIIALNTKYPRQSCDLLLPQNSSDPKFLIPVDSTIFHSHICYILSHCDRRVSLISVYLSSPCIHPVITKSCQYFSGILS